MRAQASSPRSVAAASPRPRRDCNPSPAPGASRAGILSALPARRGNVAGARGHRDESCDGAHLVGGTSMTLQLQHPTHPFLPRGPRDRPRHLPGLRAPAFLNTMAVAPA